MLGWQLVERQQLRLRCLQQAGDLGRGRGELVNDLDQPLARLDQAAGLEDAADGRGDHGLLGLADMPEHVTQEMDGAPLPRAAKHLGDRLLEALMGVGDAQPDARQPAGAQAAQELAPERPWVSASPTSMPMTSRRPLWCTP